MHIGLQIIMRLVTTLKWIDSTMEFLGSWLMLWPAVTTNKNIHQGVKQ